MKWLVTAFEPFGGAQSNSSLIAAKRLQEMDWQGNVRFYFPVPVQFTLAWTAVRKALSQHPDVDGVLALGQAETRSRLSLERVALNYVDARIADNSGFKPAPSPIEKGPEVLWSPIPWQQLGDSPDWDRSYSAGTYVCNTLMYQALHHSGKMAGFVHIPVLSSQDEPGLAAYPKMAEGTAVDALKRILNFLVELK